MAAAVIEKSRIKESPTVCRPRRQAWGVNCPDDDQLGSRRGSLRFITDEFSPILGKPLSKLADSTGAHAELAGGVGSAVAGHAVADRNTSAGDKGRSGRLDLARTLSGRAPRQPSSR